MRILSGIQSSSVLHLGRYFGALRQFLDLQREGDGYYFIADYHALTTVRDPDVLAHNTNTMALEYLALGLDPQQSILFRQSDVPETCELAWFLSTVTPMGLLQRCHSYKDKVAHGVSPDHGLFAYPVLMAADILLYRGDVVPVGQDQKQHVEVTRDIAIKFNQIYGEILTIPEPRIMPEVARVPGIDGEKMSSSYGNTVSLFESDKKTRKRFMSVVTDSTPVEDPKEPDGNTVFELYKLMASEAQIAELAEQFRAGGMGYGHAKQALYEAFLDYFGPARERYAELQKDPSTIEDVLQDGARRARETARELIAAVRDATGISRRIF
ncbi:MAG: tryptophan--tRNA ligase [Planctomycetota bacterium]